MKKYLITLFLFACSHEQTVKRTLGEEIFVQTDDLRIESPLCTSYEDLFIGEPSPPLQMRFFWKNLRKYPPVAKWVQYFENAGRKQFLDFLSEGLPYRKKIENILESSDIPKAFFYLPLIESGFSQEIKSVKGALGTWQFMPGTARRFGLVVNEYVDERLDPLRSTYAAAQYIKGLHKVFQSWFLTMAAYNAGESRIMNAVLTQNVRDFWQLAERKAIPRETAEYIPKFLAAVLVGEHLAYEHYLVRNYQKRINEQTVDFKVPSPVSLNNISKDMGVSYDRLLLLNKHLLKGITNPYSEYYTLRIPKEFENKKDKLKVQRVVLK